MKTVKIILGIIIGLSVVFFAIGLIIKETTYTTQVEIDKPVEEVFTLFNDTSYLKEWIPDLISIDTIEAKPGKTGSQYKIVVSNKKDLLKYEFH